MASGWFLRGCGVGLGQVESWELWGNRVSRWMGWAGVGEGWGGCYSTSSNGYVYHEMAIEWLRGGGGGLRGKPPYPVGSLDPRENRRARRGTGPECGEPLHGLVGIFGIITESPVGVRLGGWIELSTLMHLGPQPLVGVELGRRARLVPHPWLARIWPPHGVGLRRLLYV